MTIRVSRMRKRTETRQTVGDGGGGGGGVCAPSSDKKRVALTTLTENAIQRRTAAAVVANQQLKGRGIGGFLSISLPHETHGLGGLPLGTTATRTVENSRNGKEDDEKAIYGPIMSMASRTSALSLSHQSTVQGSPMILALSPPTVHMTVSSTDLENPKKDAKSPTSVSVQFPLCATYGKDIIEHMLEQEQKFIPKLDYMRKQPDITPGMRAILIDWLVEVADEYNLRLQTLYLTVSYVDRFLSKMSVLRNKLQLVGAASMLVAAKFEEIHPPEVEEFVYITDDTYSKKQLLKMEYLLLKILSFDLAVPTAFNFLEYFMSVTKADMRTEHLGLFLIQLTLLDCDPYLKYLPSIVAASAVALSRHTHGLPAWTPELEMCGRCSIVDMQNCIQDLHYTFSRAAKHPQKAIREKFSHSKFSCVAKTPPPTSLPI